MTTCSGINEGENKTIGWKECNDTISIENSSIVKIAYSIHFNPKEVKKERLHCVMGQVLMVIDIGLDIILSGMVFAREIMGD